MSDTDRGRSYGYIQNDKNKQKKTESPRKEKKKTRNNDSVTLEKPGIAKKVFKMLFLIILLPFKIVWFLLKVFGLVWRNKPKLEKETRRAVFKKLFFAGILGSIFLVIAIVGMAAWVSKDLPDPDKLADRPVAQSTKIYDRTGDVLLYEIFADEKRTLVDLEDIPEDLVNGVIATEDSSFYEHKGIRPLSIVRSLVYGVLGKGRLGGGASTLTQQLVKNAILTSERTITRKVKELILAVRLEQKYSKEQILKIYFNEIPYGSTNYGVESAAQSYFGKTVSELELHESAVLAGLPKAPSTYLNNSDALKTRRDFVLRRMFEEGYITEEEKNNAQAQELVLEQQFDNIKAPHFVLDVKQQLAEKYGEQLVDTGGLKVITTLDWEKQQIAEKVMEEKGQEVLTEAQANNAALLAMDPRTGQILSMLGSADFYDKEINGQFNVATLGERQPGSSFKPIIYTAAFEKGYTPDTVLFDVKTNFSASGRAYLPLNYDLQEHGPISMRQSLQGSKNITSVKTLYLVGPKKGVEFAQRLGYSTIDDEGDFGLSLVLGGGEVKLIDHVAAYSIFANGGEKVEPVSILKVEDNKGDILEEWKDTKNDRVLDKEITATISNVLSDDQARAYAFGAGGILTLPGRPVAAKTGTTNSYIDGWTIGYTPSLVTGVWVGNTNNTPMKAGHGGGRVAGPIWKNYMIQALENTPVESFPAPPRNDAEKAVLRGSAGGNITLKINRVTGNLANSTTPEKYIVERSYIPPHSVLHYVYKDEPRGPIPEDPARDPQYTIWEAAIQDWIKRKKEENPDWEVSFEEPPVEYDDAYDIEMIPKLEVLFPTPSTTITDRKINTDIRVSAKRGVSKVTYKIDNRYVGVIKEHPFNLSYNASRIDPGNHVLTIIVEDDIGNQLEEQIPFIFGGEEAKASASWVNNTATVSKNQFPKQLLLSLNREDKITALRIYAEADGNKNLVDTITNFSGAASDQAIITISDPLESGVWELVAEVESNDSKYETGRLRLTVTE